MVVSKFLYSAVGRRLRSFRLSFSRRSSLNRKIILLTPGEEIWSSVPNTVCTVLIMAAVRAVLKLFTHFSMHIYHLNCITCVLFNIVSIRPYTSLAIRSCTFVYDHDERPILSAMQLMRTQKSSPREHHVAAACLPF